MKTKGINPKDFVVKLLKRSECKVQTAACLSDKHGIFAWGVNHMGSDGFGEHAEINCFKRANPKRVQGAVLWVAACRRKSQNPVKSRPCAACYPVAIQCLYITYRDKDGQWVSEKCHD